jgi:hypothetical protein
LIGASAEVWPNNNGGNFLVKKSHSKHSDGDVNGFLFTLCFVTMIDNVVLFGTDGIGGYSLFWLLKEVPD